MEEITNCKACGAYIDLELGAYPVDWNLYADGTRDEPRSPAQNTNDICSSCEYFGEDD